MGSHEFDRPDRFVAGTVGPPGQRTFFLQAREGRRLISVSLEKQQVSILADRINDLLDDFAGGEATEQAAAETVDNAPLDTPIEDEFRVASLSLAWNPTERLIVIECDDLVDDADDSDDTDDSHDSAVGADTAITQPDLLATNSLRVRLSPAAARSFARRGAALVAAGRPPCPFCGGPLDPSGHICPRANGYKR